MLQKTYQFCFVLLGPYGKAKVIIPAEVYEKNNNNSFNLIRNMLVY